MSTSTDLILELLTKGFAVRVNPESTRHRLGARLEAYHAPTGQLYIVEAEDLATAAAYLSGQAAQLTTTSDS